jgi:hypothetical protein
LATGVCDGGRGVVASMTGVPQGGSISPLLSNIYGHALDALWAKEASTSARSSAMRMIVRHERRRRARKPRGGRCCVRDGGRAPGTALQGEVPNHRKLRRHNGRGGERCGKGVPRGRQVRARKANESEPLMKVLV